MRRVVAATVMLVVLGWPSMTAAQPDAGGPETLLLDAARRFHNADYEEALPILTRLVEMLSSRSAEPAVRDILVRTHEMRGRTAFALGRRDAARADFEQLVRLDPSRTLPAVSPAVEKMFSDVRRSLVGELVVEVDPPDAELRVDGVVVASDAKVAVLAGTHSLSATRVNYGIGTAEVTVPAGELRVQALTLQRVLASVRVTTVPPEVDVVVNGTLRGRTSTGPLSADQTEWARGRGIPADRLSTTLELNEFTVAARYELEFRRSCFVPVTIAIEPHKAANLRLETVVLEPALGALDLTAEDDGEVDVLLDGDLRGRAPLQLSGVCEGTHDVEFRSRTGSDVRKVDVKRGERVQVQGVPKPRSPQG